MSKFKKKTICVTFFFSVHVPDTSVEWHLSIFFRTFTILNWNSLNIKASASIPVNNRVPNHVPLLPSGAWAFHCKGYNYKYCPEHPRKDRVTTWAGVKFHFMVVVLILVQAVPTWGVLDLAVFADLVSQRSTTITITKQDKVNSADSAFILLII